MHFWNFKTRLSSKKLKDLRSCTNKTFNSIVNSISIKFIPGISIMHNLKVKFMI